MNVGRCLYVGLSLGAGLIGLNGCSLLLDFSGSISEGQDAQVDVKTFDATPRDIDAGPPIAACLTGEENDTSETAGPVSIGEDITAAICATNVPDVDYYKFTMPSPPFEEPQDFNLTVTLEFDEASNLELSLLDVNKTLISAMGDETPEKFTRQTAGGEYFLKVESRDPAATNVSYTLSLMTAP